MVLKLCVTEPNFPEKIFLSKKLWKWTKNGLKRWFFEFIEKLCHYFLLNLLYNENCIICCVPAQSLSILPSCLSVFLEFNHKISLNFAMVAETLIKLCLAAQFFGKTLFAPKIGEMGKIRFFNLKKKLVINFHWICSIIKMFISVFLHKSYIWRKSCSWDLGQNALSQSDCMVFKWTISPEQLEQIWCQDSKSYSI